MTNPTSYTDEQVLKQIQWCEWLKQDTAAECIRSLLADRQRLQAQCEAESVVSSSYFDRIKELQAEVEALRNGAKRLASNWVRCSASGASHSPWVHEDCAEQLRDLLQETRATPNETKEAKS